jgi:Na+/H+-dicarboxylate symporter
VVQRACAASNTPSWIVIVNQLTIYSSPFGCYSPYTDLASSFLKFPIYFGLVNIITQGKAWRLISTSRNGLNMVFSTDSPSSYLTDILGNTWE